MRRIRGKHEPPAVDVGATEPKNSRGALEALQLLRNDFITPAACLRKPDCAGFEFDRHRVRMASHSVVKSRVHSSDRAHVERVGKSLCLARCVRR